MRMRFLLACAALSSAATANAQTIPIGIRLSVPELCLAGLVGQPSVEDAKTLRLGLVREFCNNGSSHALVIQHPAGIQGGMFLLTGSAGTMKVSLSESGLTIVRSDAGNDSRELSIEFEHTDQQIGWVSVSAVAD